MKYSFVTCKWYDPGPVILMSPSLKFLQSSDEIPAYPETASHSLVNGQW